MVDFKDLEAGCTYVSKAGRKRTIVRLDSWYVTYYSGSNQAKVSHLWTGTFRAWADSKVESKEAK